jgi:hypothetical protein
MFWWRRFGYMKPTRAGLVALVLIVAACGGGEPLTSEERGWCLNNTGIVDETSEDLGLFGFVDAYYDTEGDGIGSDGEPKLTDRNIEVSEELSARNREDPDALFDDLFARYLDHPDGQEACAAAYADNS